MRTVDFQEQEIFLQASEIESTVEQKEFVFRACGENVQLRERVNGLLQLRSQGGFILDKEIGLTKTGDITTDPQGIADLTGTTIGNYHLVRLIGTGGMGDVYFAEQKAPIRRRVAVKVIKLGLDTKSFVARFDAERQALALLDHQGIIKIFDAGATPTGRPFFVMELVSGEPITQYCDENKLQPEARIRIFIKLCKAIQHAHQKGVIHRDLKPSNILMAKKDGEIIPKVIDFGVSKATLDRVPGQTDLTKLACMIGTPEYMSPEQTDTQGNDQDIRTDIYSLGAILYELLTGSTPFELEELKSRNLTTVRELIQTRRVQVASARVLHLENVKPQIFRNRGLSPKQLASRLTGNLDAIIEKCLLKDRAERYSTVTELVSDLERHLANEPIALVRQSWLTYGLSLARRHRRAMVLFSSIVVILIAVLGFSVNSAIRANRFANQANSAKALADDRLTQSNQARKDAQLAKIRAEVLERQYLKRQQELENERIQLIAIARLNKRDFAQESSKNGVIPDSPFSVSQILRNQLSSEAATLLQNETTADANEENGDRLLLHLILEEQRKRFGNSDERIAETLDQLGELHLNLGQDSLAVKNLRESLFIRTDLNPNSSERIWTMILLAKSLQNSGSEIESQAYIDSARRLLKKFPNESRLAAMLEELSFEK